MRVRPTLRIVRWEVDRTRGEVGRRTALALLGLLVLVVAAGPLLATAATPPGEGMYRVAVPADSQYREPVVESDRLRAVSPAGSPLATGRAEVLVGEERIVYVDSQKGRAAAAALRSAVKAYNDRLMRAESDEIAAFPVRVTLRLREQNTPTIQPGGGDGPGDTTGDTDGTGGGSGESGGGESGGSEPGGTGQDAPPEVGAGGGGGTLDGLLDGTQTGTPGTIRPPFPLRSLVLAFLFVLPLNVVVQAYGSSIMSERLDRRGEALLVAPVARREIVAGKTLPYLAVSLLVAGGIAAAVGAGPLAVAAVASLALGFLGATFVAAMFARSFKELTFLTVAISVFLTSYAFVPAIFAEIHPIAAISPLTLVVRDISETAVDPGTAALATGPLTVASLTLFALGTGVYREEDMFTQRPVPAKAVDALAAQVRTARRVALWSVLSVPFVLVAELFAVAVLFVAPLAASIPIVLGVVALVEEAAKSAHVYAGFARGRFEPTDRAALGVGVRSGIGFGLGEKAAIIVQFVGLPELAIGRVAFASAAAVDPLVIAAMLVAPFAMHAATAATSAVGARRSRRAFGAAYAAAVVIHLAYNLAVVSVVA